MSHDAFGPAKIEHLIENIGGTRANLPPVLLLVLGALTGAVIAFGTMFFTTTVKASSASFDFTRVVS